MTDQATRYSKSRFCLLCGGYLFRWLFKFTYAKGKQALVVGILGQLIGLFEAFKALESYEVQASTAMIMGGLKVSMITTLYGFLIFAIARVYALAAEKWKLA